MKCRINGTIRHSFVDGPGCRYVIFTQGCTHNCLGCQNPATHALEGGIETTTEEIIGNIMKERFLDGVTLSGGDPLLQPAACKAIADAVHERGLNVWAYTGWTFEQLLTMGPEYVEALKSIDVLVDGPFIMQEQDPDLLWRGSRNQRLVRARESVQLGHCVELTKGD